MNKCQGCGAQLQIENKEEITSQEKEKENDLNQ